MTVAFSANDVSPAGGERHDSGRSCTVSTRARGGRTCTTCRGCLRPDHAARVRRSASERGSADDPRFPMSFPRAPFANPTAPSSAPPASSRARSRRSACLRISKASASRFLFLRCVLRNGDDTDVRRRERMKPAAENNGHIEKPIPRSGWMIRVRSRRIFRRVAHARQRPESPVAVGPGHGNVHRAAGDHRRRLRTARRILAAFSGWPNGNRAS